MNSPRTWLWLVGISAGIVLVLALGVSPWSLVIVAAVLACPIAMYFGMRGMGRSQDFTPEPPRRLQRDPEARGTLAERDGQQPRPSQKEPTPR
jgi:Flp pilus assembly protein TadB